MRGLAALRAFGLGWAAALALSLGEGLWEWLGPEQLPLAAGQTSPPFSEVMLFFLSINLPFGFVLGGLMALPAALLAKRRPWGWSLAAAATCVVLGTGELSILAQGVAPGLQAARSWRSTTPLPAVVGPGRSIVLVSVDTWRADSLRHMPLLASRAQSAMRYETAHSTSSWTLPAMASLMTGLAVHGHGAGHRAHPSLTGVRTAISPSVPVLAERLQEQGYVTVGVLSNAYLGPQMGFHRGLDRAIDTSSRARLSQDLHRSLILRAILPLQRDDAPALVQQALQRWSRLERGRGFLWVHLSDPHAPYGVEQGGCEMPQCFASWVPARRGEAQVDQGQVQTLYEQDLARLDVALEELLVHIDTQRTLVIVVGDHGEAFGPGADVEHGQSYAHAVTQVPLLVWGPGLRAQDVERAVDLRDVHDAILQWAQVGELSALDPQGQDSLTPLASLLYGAPGSACTDGTNTLQDRGDGLVVLEGSYQPELAACVPSALPPSQQGVELAGALRVLGYIE